jgi:hypothetical protein
MPPRGEHLRAEHLRDMAWECQTLAGVVSDPGARLDLLTLAQRFERLAEMAQWQPGLPQGRAPVRSDRNP